MLHTGLIFQAASTMHYVAWCLSSVKITFQSENDRFEWIIIQTTQRKNVLIM